ncbi:glutathione S-transferase [Primorskyibacter sp. S187A]|uniref:glutathione S-transferase n=1 Tax=Primorskyibacter sp. S187A TaxID=3415130 RepID=UPI003C7C8531
MENTLYIGDYAYSSWSLRGWLLFEAFGIARSQVMIPFSADETVGDQITALAYPARTVPTVSFADGAIASDSLSIAEELATRYPDASIWPRDPVQRARARSLAGEMHSGFSRLRSVCPMNVRKSYVDVPVDEELARDLARLDTIWAEALDASSGPWLCGAYSAADAFFAPVAARVAGFSLPVAPRSMDYVGRHLEDPAFRRWRAMGLVHGETLPWYAQDLDTRDWPGPPPRPAKATEHGPARNAHCPYSGKPVTHFLEMDGDVWGFCNAFCRDKTVADPEVWPQFIDMVTDLTASA